MSRKPTNAEAVEDAEIVNETPAQMPTSPSLEVGHEHHARALLAHLDKRRQRERELEDELILANAKFELVLDELNRERAERASLAKALTAMEGRVAASKITAAEIADAAVATATIEKADAKRPAKH